VNVDVDVDVNAIDHVHVHVHDHVPIGTEPARHPASTLTARRCDVGEQSGPILLVDHDAGLGEVLQAEGYEAVRIADGSAALSWLYEHPLPPVIVVGPSRGPFSAERLRAELAREPLWATLPILDLEPEPIAAEVQDALGRVMRLCRPAIEHADEELGVGD
jgi:hypothetical protein